MNRRVGPSHCTDSWRYTAFKSDPSSNMPLLLRMLSHLRILESGAHPAAVCVSVLSSFLSSHLQYRYVNVLKY